jgi:hypothetical protein
MRGMRQKRARVRLRDAEPASYARCWSVATVTGFDPLCFCRRKVMPMKPAPAGSAVRLTMAGYDGPLPSSRRGPSFASDSVSAELLTTWQEWGKCREIKRPLVAALFTDCEHDSRKP